MQSHFPCADMIDGVTLTDNTKKWKIGGPLNLPFNKQLAKHKSELRNRAGRVFTEHMKTNEG
ncbi:hypothetical protein [Aliiglaciecola sp. M165]|uniref:hypothetical protein n=1 Tax=Aliiglaciecola sp. M165 TaxID=2593649 RepID=UPI00117CFA0E|nr:hypothetical protein [Aliiglaciecola sp. M165]TRY28749.1 hypothetical protein FM019_20495 [Aliiglaciecola sp. M165]